MSSDEASDASETVQLLRRANDVQATLLELYARNVTVQTAEFKSMASENVRLLGEKEQHTTAVSAMDETIQQLQMANTQLKQTLLQVKVETARLVTEHNAICIVHKQMQIDAKLANMLIRVLQHERGEMQTVAQGSVVWVMDPELNDLHIIKRQVAEDDMQGNVKIMALSSQIECTIAKRYIFMTTFTVGDLVSVRDNLFGQVTKVLTEHCMVLVVNEDSSALYAQTEIVIQEYLPGDKITTKTGDVMTITRYEAINNTLQVSNDHRQCEMSCSDVIFVSRGVLCLGALQHT